MKILHLTDIHISEDIAETVLDRAKTIAQAFSSNLVCNDTVVILISGDIAYSGSTSEYKVASEFLKIIIDYLRDTYMVSVNVLIVPGNHDCDFSKENSVREILISSINTGRTVDNDIINNVTACQDNFFEFCKNYVDYSDNRL